ncbi:TPA: hypothetical protein DEP21_00690 [Patescibacteria group bacterium]|nr:hypothetical protein [Candidatus Gracilibacteria bacterium]
MQSYNEFTGFVKLQAVKELEGNYSEDIPWSTHIQKVIAMLGDIKNLDMSQDETLVLSDFNVSLDKLSVRGKVSNLLLLYYTSAEKGMTSLIDRFKKLDFISDMRIKNYTKNKDTGFFSFVLEANVNKDGK